MCNHQGQKFSYAERQNFKKAFIPQVRYIHLRVRATKDADGSERSQVSKNIFLIINIFLPSHLSDMLFFFGRHIMNIPAQKNF